MDDEFKICNLKINKRKLGIEYIFCSLKPFRFSQSFIEIKVKIRPTLQFDYLNSQDTTEQKMICEWSLMSTNGKLARGFIISIFDRKR